jgi:hypothetical protein
MAYEVSCNHCGTRFSLSDDLYARRVKGSIATIRCRRCSRDLIIDDTLGRAVNLMRRRDNDVSRAEPISERGITPRPPVTSSVPPPHTPRVEVLAGVAGSASRDSAMSRPKGAARPQPPPVPRKTKEATARALWVISYAEDDDRELTQSQIRSALVRGEIHAGTIVWQEGMPEWVPLQSVPELAALLPKPGEVLLHRLPGERNPRRPSSRPPPKPDIEASVPTLRRSGVVRPVRSNGELSRPESAERKPRTRPDLPRVMAKSAGPAESKQTEEAPPSSGTPALRALTEKDPIVAKSRATEDFLIGLQSSDPGLLARSLTAADVPRTPDLSDDAPTPALPRALAEQSPHAHGDVPEPAQGRNESARGLASNGVSGSQLANRERAATARASTPESSRALPAQSAAPGAYKRSSRRRTALIAVASVLMFVLGASAALLRRPAPHSTDSEVVAAAKPAALAVRSRSDEGVQGNRATADPVAAAHEVPSAAVASPAATYAKPAKDFTQAAEAADTRAAAQAKAEREAKSLVGIAETATAQRDRQPMPSKETEAHGTEPEREIAPGAAEPAVTTPFDKSAAVVALNGAASQASACRRADDPTGTAEVIVTFAPSGRVTTATVTGPPFAGTATGGCIARMLRQAKIPAFAGEHVTVSKSVVVQ